MNTSTHSIDESFLQIRGQKWAALTARKRARVVDQAFHYWRARGFPYYEPNDRQIEQEFTTLRNKDWQAVFSGSNLRSSNTGLRIANAFQPTMWKAKVSRYRTPLEVFLDDCLLRKAIERALTIWPDRFGANASCLRRILKSFPSTASVSNYRPMVAKAVMGKYSRQGPVVDFSAGYGGRLLGALALGGTYIGIEPNRAQTTGFRRMKDVLGRLQFSLPKIKILNGIAEIELLRLSSESAELVFSSPPFFDWEHYSESSRQSFRRFPDYDAWFNGFLKPVVAESHRILERHGYLVLNVTNGNRLPSASDVMKAAKIAGFKLLTCHHMVFPKIPYLHPRNGQPAKSELLLVFRK
jgi:hypothetical protein